MRWRGHSRPRPRGEMCCDGCGVPVPRRRFSAFSGCGRDPRPTTARTRAAAARPAPSTPVAAVLSAARVVQARRAGRVSARRAGSAGAPASTTATRVRDTAIGEIAVRIAAPVSAGRSAPVPIRPWAEPAAAGRSTRAIRASSAARMCRDWRAALGSASDAADRIVVGAH
jgi:hypothetical protein